MQPSFPRSGAAPSCCLRSPPVASVLLHRSAADTTISCLRRHSALCCSDVLHSLTTMNARGCSGPSLALSFCRPDPALRHAPAPCLMAPLPNRHMQPSHEPNSIALFSFVQPRSLLALTTTVWAFGGLPEPAVCLPPLRHAPRRGPPRPNAPFSPSEFFPCPVSCPALGPGRAKPGTARSGMTLAVPYT